MKAASRSLAAGSQLDGHSQLHATRANLLRRLGRRQEARDAYRRALELATNRVEQDYLRRRLTALNGGPAKSGSRKTRI